MASPKKTQLENLENFQKTWIAHVHIVVSADNYSFRNCSLTRNKSFYTFRSANPSRDAVFLPLLRVGNRPIGWIGPITCSAHHCKWENVNVLSLCISCAFVRVCGDLELAIQIALIKNCKLPFITAIHYHHHWTHLLVPHAAHFLNDMTWAWHSATWSAS